MGKPVNKTLRIAAMYAGEEIGHASGPVVTFRGNSAPLRSLLVNIDPVQDLHGYENPWPAGGGKNKFAVPSGLPITSKGITLFYDGYHYVVTGTATGTVRTQDLALDLAVGVYILSANQTSDKTRVVLYKNGTLIRSQAKNDAAYSFNVESGDVITCGLQILSSAENCTIEPQIESGSTATTYAPYSNICPISGWSEVNVWRTGKNLLPAKFYRGMGYNGAVGTHYVLTELHDVTQNGNTFSRTVSSWNGFGMISGRLPQGTYKCNIAFSCTSPRTSLYVLDSDMTITRRIGNLSANGTWKSTITIAEGEAFIAVVIFSSDAGTVSVTEPQIELGSTPTEYDPYSGNQYTIQLGQTVYGGTLDVTNGVLTVNGAMVDMGTLDWTYLETYQFFQNTQLPKAKGLDNAKCSVYAYGGWWSVWEGKDCVWCGNLNTSSITIKDTRYTTATDFKAAMSGVQLCYELATPIIIPLTPTEISTLQGQNNLWADSGDVDVEYVATGGEGGKLALLLRNRKELLIALRKGLSPAEVGLLGSIPSFGGSLSPGVIRPGLNTQEEEEDENKDA